MPESYKPNYYQIQSPEQKSFIIYGGGSHAREMNYNLLFQGVNQNNIQIYDAKPDSSWCKTKANLEVNHVDQIDYDLALKQGTQIILAIGNPEIRAKITDQINSQYGVDDNKYAIVAHPSAIISYDSEIESGAMILQGSSIGTGAKIGKMFFGNTASIVGHDNIIGENVSLYTGATLAGHVEVGEQTLIAMRAKIINGKIIGSNCVIGMGANVLAKTKIARTGEKLTDIPDGAIVMGGDAAQITGFKYTKPDVITVQQLSQNMFKNKESKYNVNKLIDQIRNGNDISAQFQLEDLISKVPALKSIYQKESIFTIISRKLNAIVDILKTN